MATSELEKLYPYAFSFGGSLEINGELLTFTVSRAGILSVPSGRIIVCDPFVRTSDQPFVQSVLPGSYPVDISLVRRGDSSVEQIAYTRILLTKREPTVWVPALTSRPTGREPIDQPPGYRSSSGTGALMDVTTRDYLKFDSIEEVDKVLEQLAKNFKPTRNWLDYSIDENLNAIIFSSGYGKGYYPSFFAIDDKGDVAALVTSFLII